MKFRQFAWRNVVRNRRTYGAYFMSSAFSVMVFFVYAMFISHPDMVHSDFGVARDAMTVAEYIIYIFSFFFVFYSVSAFLKSRKHEFGVLMMHGMSRSQLHWLVFLENMMIGAGSILTGILVGMVFSNLFLMIGAQVLGIDRLPFYWPVQALWVTVAAFIILFFVISLFTALFVRNNKLIELLRGNAKPKQDPKTSVFRSVLAAGLLLSGYAISFLVKGTAVVVAMVPVVVVVTIGTYFLFSQWIVHAVRMLKRRRSLYWRKTNMLTISDLAYRMKDNARMYFIVAIVSTVTLCALGTFSGFQQVFVGDIRANYPFELNYVSLPGNPDEQEQAAVIEQTLQERGVEYRQWEARLRIAQSTGQSRESVMILPLSEFNQLSQALGYPVERLNRDELIRVHRSDLAGAFGTMAGQTGESGELQQLGGQTYDVSKTLDRSIVSSEFTQYQSYYVMLDDQLAVLDSTVGNTYYAFELPGIRRAVEVGQAIETLIPGGEWYRFTSQAEMIHQIRSGYNLFLFIGLFVSVVFFVATGSFLYFRLYTDLADDKKHYQAIAKIGLAMHELKRIATTQVALLFYAPFLVAVMHTAVALYALHSLFNKSVLSSALIVIGGFFVAQTLFFLLIRARYVRHLQEAIR